MNNLRKNENAVSPVIAVILMVAITVILAATVFVLLTNLKPENPAPAISFTKGQNDLTVSKAPTGISWTDIHVTGCTKPTNGNVTAGDTLTSCNGTVKIIHLPTNTLLYETRF